MKVPAWPMPIHQTKFTIAKPQATGMLTPQIPTPRMSSQPMATVQQHQQHEREGETRRASRA